MTIASELTRISGAKAALKTAINAKGGELTTELLDDYADAVTSLPSGTDTSDADATAGDILIGKTAYVNGTKLTGTITSFTDVAVSDNSVLIPIGYSVNQLTKTVGQALAAATITPTTTDQVIPAGKFTTGAQTIKGDANLVAGNIKKNVSLFGVTGNYEGAGSTSHYKCSALVPESWKGTAAETLSITGAGYPGVDGTYTLLPATVTQVSQDYYLTNADHPDGNAYIIRLQTNQASTLGWTYYLLDANDDPLYMCDDGKNWYASQASAPAPTWVISPWTAASWNGYKASVDPVTGVWSFAETATTGLPYDRITPVVGRVYDRSCTYRVSEFDSGIPIPSSGLVFYAPLANDRVDIIGTASMTYSNGTFTTTANKACMSFNGDGWIEWAGGLNIPSGSDAMSIFGLAYFDNTNADWRYLFGFSDGSYGSMFGLNNYKTNLYARIVSNGNYDWNIGTTIQGLKWYSFALTMDSSGVVKAYVDGSLVNSVNTGSRNIGKSKITLGASSVNHEFCQYGKFADFAIYNRELSAAEVLAMHQALMPE